MFRVIVFLFIHIVMHKIFLCLAVDFVSGHSVVEPTVLLLLLLSFVLIAMLIVLLLRQVLMVFVCNHSSKVI